MELTSKQRAQLRGIANGIDTILIVGIVLGVLACVAVGFIAFKKK